MEHLTFFEWPGFLIIFAFAFLMTMVFASRFPGNIQKIIAGAFVVHAFGSALRFLLLQYIYHWNGDAIGYYAAGYNYSKMIWDMDFSFLNPQFGDTRMWGTPMMKYISGFVLSVIGPSMRGEFLLFAFLSLSGLILFVKAFQGSYPQEALKQYAIWTLFWPSLWYWPSSVGKDAWILMGFGIVVYGFAGTANKIRWIPVLIGLGLISVIRPHVAGVLVVSIAAAHLLSIGRKLTPGFILQGILIVALGIFFVYKGLTDLRIEADVGDIQDFVQNRTQHSTQGGSAVDTPGLSPIQAPLTVVNVLFRPAPWEATSPTYAAAFLDIYAFWFLAWKRRKRIKTLLREWRSHRLLRLAVPFTALYVAMLGFAVGNLGIIARQRIMIMPFLLMWLEAVPQEAAAAEFVPTFQRRPFAMRMRRNISQPSKSRGTG